MPAILPLLLLLVTVQRLLELVIARRHTQQLLAEGGHEIGQAHYPLVVLLHAGWLISLWAYWLTGSASLQVVPMVAYLLVQPLRLWVMISLGRYWTTRIIVMPQIPVVRRGPYRWLPHPNYLVVVLEIALLPLALGAWPLALFFSMANALVLRLRIRIEAQSLQPRRQLSTHLHHPS